MPLSVDPCPFANFQLYRAFGSQYKERRWFSNVKSCFDIRSVYTGSELTLAVTNEALCLEDAAPQTHITPESADGLISLQNLILREDVMLLTKREAELTAKLT